MQGSKEQQGELFGIQNLLKFSDESLLKTLRMKHEAGLAAAALGDEPGTGGSKVQAALGLSGLSAKQVQPSVDQDEFVVCHWRVLRNGIFTTAEPNRPKTRVRLGNDVFLEHS